MFRLEPCTLLLCLSASTSSRRRCKGGMADDGWMRGACADSRGILSCLLYRNPSEGWETSDIRALQSRPRRQGASGESQDFRCFVSRSWKSCPSIRDGNARPVESSLSVGFSNAAVSDEPMRRPASAGRLCKRVTFIFRLAAL
ncbi:hypothetical protein DFH08DRAFT_359716 [Mycena albidolilacea]|uniref:Secreted protein n=1 Tax=Mycena albidolilacea TaxID=1033008 RepID=A0AAD7AJG0_9AGAR|nr:hypothetical protein DFH08DRAFT_359716 [Mycena albidolilacea]